MCAVDAVNAASAGGTQPVNDLITKKIRVSLTTLLNALLTTNLRLWLTMIVNLTFTINVPTLFQIAAESAMVPG
jgi:hypothetical protein